MENALEITIIGVLGGIAAALIAVGGVGFFWLASRIDRLTEQNNTTHKELGEKTAVSHKELSEKIDQSHKELSEKFDDKIDSAIGQLREDFTRQLEQVKAEIINALLHHSHPEPGGPPVFTVPPPVVPPDSLPQETEPAPAPADN